MSLIYQDLSSIDIDIDIDIGDPTTMTKNMKLSLVKEFLQVEDIGRTVALQILTSKRLLSDHLDILEEHVVENQMGYQSEFITFKKCIGLIAVSAAGYFLLPQSMHHLKLVLPAGCCLFGSVYGLKRLNRMLNKNVINRIDTLIDFISQYEMCMRRNISYMNECSLMKNKMCDLSEFIIERDIIKECLSSVAHMTTVLYNYTKKLENDFPISSQYDEVYSPLGDIYQLDIIKNPGNQASVKTFKDYYQLFAIVQSDFLCRLGLAVIDQPRGALKFCKHHLNDVISNFENIIDKDVASLQKITDSSSIHNQWEMIKRSNQSITSDVEPIISLKLQSLHLTAKLLAVTNEVRQLDRVIQKIIEAPLINGIPALPDRPLMDLIPSFEELTDSMEICQNEMQRLCLLYHRMMNIEPSASPSNAPVMSNNSTLNENELEKYSSETKPTSEDYFAMIWGDQSNMSREETDISSISERIEELDEKSKRKQFKPVLKQLKTAISEIDHTMREREKSYLETMGVDVDKFYNEESDDDMNDNDTQENFSSKRSDMYNDVRKMLMEKKQVRLMPLPTENLLSEDILE